MRACLIALTAALLVIFPIHQSWAAAILLSQSSNSANLDLPSALLEDDSFDDLPFEQLRQALREEVERGQELFGVLEEFLPMLV